MAMDGIGYVSIHLSGRPFTTVEWVNEVLLNCEYGYNLAVAVLMTNDPGISKITPADLGSMLGYDLSGFLSERNAEFRAIIKEDDRLRVEQLISDQSFSLKLGGISKAIEALMVLFDPIERDRRRESARHEREMNQLTELMARNSYLAEIVNDPDSVFNRIADEQLGEAKKNELHEKIYQASSGIIDSLHRSNVQIIEGTIELPDEEVGS